MRRSAHEADEIVGSSVLRILPPAPHPASPRKRGEEPSNRIQYESERRGMRALSFQPLIEGSRRLMRERRFVRFLAVGALNTAFGYSVFYLLLAITGHSIASLAVATVLGALFNFRSIGSLVFGSSDPRLLMRFIGVYAAVFLVNAAGLRMLEGLGVGSALAAALLVPFVAALTYRLTRDFVFSTSTGSAA
jgi:putative flippase GtrA